MLQPPRLCAFPILPLVMISLAGCSGASSFGDRFAQSVETGTPTAAAAPVAGAKPLDNCPVVELRQGAGTLSVANTVKDPSNLNLRYQVSVVQTARECANLGGTFTAKIGLHGRVVTGPAGGPGTIEIPVRYALVEEGAQPKTVWTKLHKVPVSIAPDQPHVTFTHVEESLAVPMPAPGVLDRYVIYVGFDPIGAQEKRPPARKRPAKG